MGQVPKSIQISSNNSLEYSSKDWCCSKFNYRATILPKAHSSRSFAQHLIHILNFNPNQFHSMLDPITFYAILRVLLSAILLLLQLAILPLFFIYSDYRKNICYRIMLAIGLVDICQLLVNGLFIFFGLINFEYSEQFEKWSGALNASSWDILFVLQMLLATNRLSVILKNSFLITVKKQELPWERVLFNLLLFFTFILFLGIVSIFASSYCGLIFNPTKFYWSYNIQSSWAIIVRDIEFKATGFLPLVTFCAYCLIVGLLKWRRSPLNTEQNGRNVKKELLNMQERRILLQSGLQFLLLSILMLFSYFLPQGATLDVVAMLNIGSIVVCGINPFLYLAMNVQFRDRFFMMFHCQGEHAERIFAVSHAAISRKMSRIQPMNISMVQRSNVLMKRPMTMPTVMHTNNPYGTRNVRRGTLFV